MRHTLANTPENNVKKQIDKLLKAYEYLELTTPFPHPFNAYGFQELCKKHKILWWHKPNAGAYGRAGIPDYMGCMAGKMFGIEAKADGNKLTQLQHNCIGQIRESGGLVFVIHGQTDEQRQIILNNEYLDLEQWLSDEHAAYKARHTLHLDQP